MKPFGLEDTTYLSRYTPSLTSVRAGLSQLPRV